MLDGQPYLLLLAATSHNKFSPVQLLILAKANAAELLDLAIYLATRIVSAQQTQMPALNPIIVLNPVELKHERQVGLKV